MELKGIKFKLEQQIGLLDYNDRVCHSDSTNCNMMDFNVKIDFKAKLKGPGRGMKPNWFFSL